MILEVFCQSKNNNENDKNICEAYNTEAECKADKEHNCNYEEKTVFCYFTGKCYSEDKEKIKEENCDKDSCVFTEIEKNGYCDGNNDSCNVNSKSKCLENAQNCNWVSLGKCTYPNCQRVDVMEEYCYNCEWKEKKSAYCYGANSDYNCSQYKNIDDCEAHKKNLCYWIPAIGDCSDKTSLPNNNDDNNDLQEENSSKSNKDNKDIKVDNNEDQNGNYYLGKILNKIFFVLQHLNNFNYKYIINNLIKIFGVVKLYNKIKLNFLKIK
jgi:hypothetical protein